MTSPVQDLLAGLIAHLKAQDVITTQVAQRVFGMELPEEEAASMPRKAIVLMPAGGLPIGDTLRLDAARIDAHSYGATPFEAMEVRRALRAAMKEIVRVKVDSVLLHWARPAGGFGNERDPQTAWPRVFESYSVLAAEPQAA